MLLWVVVAAVVMAVGVFVGVMAVQQQLAGEPFLTVALWYAVAFIVLAFGKMAKMKACSCPSHCM